MLHEDQPLVADCGVALANPVDQSFDRVGNTVGRWPRPRRSARIAA